MPKQTAQTGPFTLIANLTFRRPLTDVRAEVITAYLSNRVDASLYTVTGQNIGDVEWFSMNGSDWLEVDQPVTREPVTTYAPTKRKQGVPHWVRNDEPYEGGLTAEEAIAELAAEKSARTTSAA